MNQQLEAGDLTRAEALGLLAWWVEAGVDIAVQDEPRDWRKAAAPARNRGRSALSASHA